MCNFVTLSIRSTEFVKWVTSLFLLTSSCLTYIYTVSFFATKQSATYNSTHIHIYTNFTDTHVHNYIPVLNITVSDSFKSGDFTETYKCFLVKLLFFTGFAISHFTVGFLGDYLGKWIVFKNLIKILIISGMLICITSNFDNISFSELENKCQFSSRVCQANVVSKLLSGRNRILGFPFFIYRVRSIAKDHRG